MNTTYSVYSRDRNDALYCAEASLASRGEAIKFVGAWWCPKNLTRVETSSNLDAEFTYDRGYAMLRETSKMIMRYEARVVDGVTGLDTTQEVMIFENTETWTYPKEG